MAGNSLQSRLWREVFTLRLLGPVAWLRVTEYRILNLFTRTRAPKRLTSRVTGHGLYYRPGATDFPVFRQIFVEQEYSCIDDLANVGLVIDCGANVGYSSAYFLAHFPCCMVIALEPDPDNFEMMELNLKCYGDRSRRIRAGVWSHTGTLKLSDTKFRDGREWSRQVVECEPGDRGAFPAIDIGTILDDSEYDRISILKVDIEGAEAIMFASNYESWLDRVDNLVIELHPDSQFGDALSVFDKALAGRRFTRRRCGELTVCRRIS